MISIKTVRLLSTTFIALTLFGFQLAWGASSAYDRIIEASLKFEQSIVFNKMVVGSPSQYQYLNSLIQKLSPDHAEHYRIHIIDNPIANAFALPNGFIGIHTGLLASLDSEAQLAMVLAHEMSHIQLNHGLHKRENVNNSGFVTVIPLVGNALLKAIANSYSRDMEQEADIEGFHIVGNAGYDQSEGIHALSRLEDFSTFWVYDDNGDATHPEIPDRIEYLNQHLNLTNTVSNESAYQKIFHELRVSQFKNALERRQFDWLIHRMSELTSKSSEPAWYFYLAEAYRQRNKNNDIQLAQQTLTDNQALFANYPLLIYSQALLNLSRNELPQAKQNFEDFLSKHSNASASELAYANVYLSHINSQL